MNINYARESIAESREIPARPGRFNFWQPAASERRRPETGSSSLRRLQLSLGVGALIIASAISGERQRQ